MHTHFKAFLAAIFTTTSISIFAMQPQPNGVDPEQKRLAAEYQCVMSSSGQNCVGGSAQNGVGGTEPGQKGLGGIQPQPYSGVANDPALLAQPGQPYAKKLIAAALAEQMGYDPSNFSGQPNINNGQNMPGAQMIPMKISDELAQAAIDNSDPLVRKAISRLNTLAFDDPMRPKCMLLVGPAGTGKTTLGAAIANHCNCSNRFYYYRATQIANQWQNSGNLNLVDIFQQAHERNRFCIIAIDELQVLFDKAKNIHSPENDLLNTLWSQLDNFKDSKIFFIGMLNPVKDMPATITTRFDPYIIRASLPNLDQRRRVLEYCVQQNHKVEFSKEMQPEKLAASTDGFNCRDLAKTFNEACQLAIEENGLGKKAVQTKPIVEMAHFNEALSLHHLALKVAAEQSGFIARLGNHLSDSFPRIVEAVIVKIAGNAIDGMSNDIYNKRHGIDPAQEHRDARKQHEINTQLARVEAEQRRYHSPLSKRDDHTYVELNKLCKMLDMPKIMDKPDNKEQGKKN